MDIKVHRGLEQIGGCITEISTATSRVFIDFGQNLPGNGEATTPEQDRLMGKTSLLLMLKSMKRCSILMAMKIMLGCLNTYLLMFHNI